MKLLLVTSTYPHPRNPARGAFNRELVRALRRIHEVRVISPVPWTEGRGGQYDKEAWLATGVDHPTFYYPPKLMRAYYGRFYWWSIRPGLQQLLRRFSPDLVLGYWTHPDSEAAIEAARLANVPAVVMVGGSDIRLLTRNPMRRAAITRVLNRADHVVAFSRDLAERVAALGIHQSRISVVYRGIDRDTFQAGDRVQARWELGIPAEELVFLWAGRMVEVKNPDLLLEVCRRWNETSSQAWRLVMIGNGPLRRRIERQVEQFGLHDRIQMEKPIPHQRMATWYQAADRTMLTSNSEGVPNVLLESIACGTPFVSTAVGGVPEIQTPGLDAVCPPGDASAFVQALRASLQRDDAPARQFEPAGLKEFARQFGEILTATIDG